MIFKCNIVNFYARSISKTSEIYKLWTNESSDKDASWTKDEIV